MALYDVTFTRTEGITFRVEADSREQAEAEFLGTGDEIASKTLDITVTEVVEVVRPERAEPIVIREGAAVRTADELRVQFIADALDIDGNVLSPYGRTVYDAATALLAGGTRHLEDEGLDVALEVLVGQVDSALADHVVTWNDGYTIEPYVEGADYSD